VAGSVVRIGGNCELLPAVQTANGLLTIGQFSFDFSTTDTPPPDVALDESGAPTVECDEDQQAAFGCDDKVHVLDELGNLVFFGDDTGVGEAISPPSFPSPGSFMVNSFFDVFLNFTNEGDPLADEGEEGVAPFFMPTDQLGADGSPIPEVFGFLVGDPLAADGEPGGDSSGKMEFIVVQLPGGGEGIMIIDDNKVDDGLLAIAIVVQNTGFDGFDGESFTGLMLLGGAGFDGETGETQGAIIVMPGELVGFNPQPEPPALAIGIVVQLGSPETPGVFIVGNEAMGLMLAGFGGAEGESSPGETQGFLFIGGLLGDGSVFQGLKVNICSGEGACNQVTIVVQ